MKKYLKKIFLFSFLAIIILFTFCVNTYSSVSDKISQTEEIKKQYPWVINKYDIDIKVNEDNSFDITERITAYFNVKRHGIIRKIPLVNTVKRLDKTTSTNKAKISDWQVLYAGYKAYKENGFFIMKLGSEDTTLLGEKTYLIKYKYSLGRDPLKDKDELYFNIIGDKWDTVIDNITFKITMPKPFEFSRFGFSSGNKGEIKNDKVKFFINGETIEGSYEGILSPNQALTVRGELPEGYFVNNSEADEKSFSMQDWGMREYIICGLPLIFLLISILIWYIYGKDDKPIEVVEFYPPDNLNSLEIAYIYNGNAEESEVNSLLVYLANKGYLKIEEKADDNDNFNFKFIKLKDYDDQNELEKMFLDGLFKYDRKYVTDDKLYDDFYTTEREILKRLKKLWKYKIFNFFSKQETAIAIMIIISFYMVAFIPILPHCNALSLWILFWWDMMCLVIISKKASRIESCRNLFDVIMSIIEIIFHVGFAAFFGYIPLCLLVIISDTEFLLLYPYIFVMLCIVGMKICLCFLPKRSVYGTRLLGRIKGFRNFLKLVEKDKLEALVLKDPNYFYNILPYTYALGISRKWVEKFETISLKEPDWYKGNESFNTADFCSSMSYSMNRISDYYVPSSSDSSDWESSSDSDSGGGCSGGGSGGGGGSSW